MTHVMKMFLVVVAFVGLAACQPTTAGGDVSQGGERWTGVVAVVESSEVWRLYDQAGGPNEQFVRALETGLENGTVEAAAGRFEFIPYSGGRPIADAHVVDLRLQHNGTWYFQGPARFFGQGQAMCVRAPREWGGLAAHNRFPARADPRTNCTPDIVGPVGTGQYDAPTIPMVMPAG